MLIMSEEPVKSDAERGTNQNWCKMRKQSKLTQSEEAESNSNDHHFLAELYIFFYKFSNWPSILTYNVHILITGIYMHVEGISLGGPKWAHRHEVFSKKAYINIDYC